MTTPGMKKTMLLLKKAEIEARIGGAFKYIDAKDEPASLDISERNMQAEKDEVMYSLEQEALAELVQINLALKRLEEGQYAKCSRCGMPITEKRVKAFPTTRLCFNCECTT